ncbi:hypothetical protein B4Q13_19415, partial [Lacticaseibacillus rhamnosus]
MGRMVGGGVITDGGAVLNLADCYVKDNQGNAVGGGGIAWLGAAMGEFGLECLFSLQEHIAVDIERRQQAAAAIGQLVVALAWLLGIELVGDQPLGDFHADDGIDAGAFLGLFV